MSIKVMGMVFERQMSPTDKLIALCLADHAHDDGTRVYPSVAALAHKASMGTTATRAAIRRLEHVGILVQVRAGGGRANPAEYRFDLAVLANPTESVAFPETTKPNASATKPNGSTPETQRLDDETQRIGVAESSEPSVNLEPSESSLAPTSSSRRTPLFDELFLLNTGTHYGPGAQITDRERTKIGMAAAALTKAGATPEQVLASATAWAELYPNATWTPQAAVQHWSKLVAMMERGYVSRGERENDYDRSLRRLREVEARAEVADA